MKNRDYKMYAAVIDGKETVFEADPSASENSSESVKWATERVVRESGLTTPRSNPQTVRVRVEAFGVKDGKMVRTLYRDYDIRPPLARMTDAEYVEERDSALLDVPCEFCPVLSDMAWERGHSSGYEEVINYLLELVAELKPVIESYGKRMAKEAKLVSKPNPKP